MATTDQHLTPSRRSRHPRESSGVYNLFDAKQVQQFKEAFSMIDQDSDGLITESDLKSMLSSLGQSPIPSLLSALLSSRPATMSASDTAPGITFTTFLTMMGEHLLALDPEAELLEAFESFDEGDTGFVKKEDMGRWLREVADRMSQEEVDRFLNGPFTDKHGNFNYREWAASLRVVPIEEDEGADGH